MKKPNKKNPNKKKFSKFKGPFKKFAIKIFWRKRLLRRLKTYQYSRKFFRVLTKETTLFLKNTKKYSHKIYIRISPNNIYCTLIQIAPEKTLLVGSAGKFRVRMSRKLLRRYALERILRMFIIKTERLLSLKGVIVYLIAPIKTRKRILKWIFRLRKYSFIKSSLLSKKKIKTKGFRAVLIKVFSKKIFNGCRAAKKKRKKRKNWRLGR